MPVSLREATQLDSHGGTLLVHCKILTRKTHHAHPFTTVCTNAAGSPSPHADEAMQNSREHRGPIP